jgi:hypothetical protein
VAHPCNWPGCRKETDLYACKGHWYKIPPAMRQRLMANYIKGKVFKTKEYNEVVKEIELFISTHGSVPA